MLEHPEPPPGSAPDIYNYYYRKSVPLNKTESSLRSQLQKVLEQERKTFLKMNKKYIGMLLQKVWMTIVESGWNVWVWLVGVVSRRWVWLVGVGGIYGCGCNKVYRFPHTTYPYSCCICYFLQQHPYFLLFIKMFFLPYTAVQSFQTFFNLASQNLIC